MGGYLDTMPDGGNGDLIVGTKIETNLWELKVFSMTGCRGYKIVDR